MTLNPCFGERLLTASIKLSLISFTVQIGMLSPFGKRSYGQLEWLKWILGGKMGMVRELDFRKTNGLVCVVLLFNSRKYIPLLMNMASP
jgi:hypothetical protein